MGLPCCLVDTASSKAGKAKPGIPDPFFLGGRTNPTPSILVFPGNLKFNFMASILAFVFDAERRAVGDINGFAVHRNAEVFALLDAIRQAAQFGYKLIFWVGLGDVSVGHNLGF